MNILFVNVSHFISGAEASLFEVLRGLDKKKHTVFLASPSVPDQHKLNGGGIIYYKLPFIWLVKSYNPLRVIRYALCIINIHLRLIRFARVKEIDVVYANTLKSFIYVAFLKILVPKCKLVCHIRDNISSKFSQWFIVKFSDKVISVSEHINNQFESNSSKKQVVYGGIELNQKTSAIKYPIRDSLGLNPDTMLLAQVGQITRWKNHIHFIKAAHRIVEKNSNVHFIVIGDDLSGRETQYKKELIALVEDLDLSEHFSFLGHREDAFDLLWQIDILIHPAINEPFGRVIIEAMLQMKPVVAYRCGGPSEIVVKGKTGYLVEPHSIEEITEKTICLLQSRELRLQFGEAGRKRVMEHFNKCRYIKEVESVLNDL